MVSNIAATDTAAARIVTADAGTGAIEILFLLSIVVVVVVFVIVISDPHGSIHCQRKAPPQVLGRKSDHRRAHTEGLQGCHVPTHISVKHSWGGGQRLNGDDNGVVKVVWRSEAVRGEKVCLCEHDSCVEHVSPHFKHFALSR